MRKSVTLCSYVIAAEISWLRSKVHVLIMVADRWPDGITCKGTTG